MPIEALQNTGAVSSGKNVDRKNLQVRPQDNSMKTCLIRMPGLSQKYCPSSSSNTVAPSDWSPSRAGRQEMLQNESWKKSHSQCLLNLSLTYFMKLASHSLRQGTLLARLGNQCVFSSLPQDSLFLTTRVTPLPIDILCPSLHPEFYQ